MSKMKWNKISQANVSQRRYRQWEDDERERLRRAQALTDYEQKRATVVAPPTKKKPRKSRQSFDELMKRFGGKQ